MSLRWEEKLELEIEPASQKVAPPPEVEATEQSFESKQVEEAARNSLDFLAGLCMPLVFRYLFPSVFKTIWQWLIQNINKVRDFSQLAIGLPRGFGKTALIKLFVVFCVLFTRRNFILIICGTATKANNVVADIMGMLEEPNIRRVFGDWRVGKEIDRQDMKKFGFRGRNIIIAAAGASSDIRGITLNNERPDVMIFDDIQTREDADSEIISTGIETWMVGTAMKAKSPHGCLFVFIANMYPTPHSILRKLKTNKQWNKFIAGGILLNAKNEPESLWEDLQPLHQLLREYENDLAMGRPEIFNAEVLNDENASVNHIIDISKIPPYPFEPGDIPVGKFIVVDPANDKSNSDAVSIGYFEIHMEKPYLMDVVEDTLSPLGIIEATLKMGFKWNCPFVVIEADAFQYSLQYWWNYITTQRQILGFQCEPIYSGGKNKIATIIAMFQQLLKGEVGFSPEVRGQVLSQILSFNPLKSNNVDGILDLLKYSTKVIQMYGPVIVSLNTIEAQELDKVEVLEENSPF